MKNILLAALLSLMLSSCGYTMAGFNNEIPVKYYINTVQNDTIDSSLGDIMQLEAERFFIAYNELASYKNASYFIDIIISNLEYVDPILAATDQATSTNLTYDLTMVVTNIEGKEIYTWNTTISSSFSAISRGNVKLALTLPLICTTKPISSETVYLSLYSGQLLWAINVVFPVSSFNSSATWGVNGDKIVINVFKLYEKAFLSLSLFNFSASI